MRRNFPHVYSSRPLAYKSNAYTHGHIGEPKGTTVWGNGRTDGAPYAEVSFWRDVGRGGQRDLMGTFGASQGAGGFSLPVGTRVPITWRTEKEVVDAWNSKLDM